MQKNLWYKGKVPKIRAKKTEQILMKVAPETLRSVKSVAENEDRPLGYVARELMIRGLALYEQDGLLRFDSHNGQKDELPAMEIHLGKRTRRKTG